MQIRRSLYWDGALGARQTYFAGVTILWCPYLLSGKTSYCQISLSLEVARNFTGNDAAEVPVKF